MKQGLQIEEFGLMSLTASELITVDGGDSAYYGKGADLGLAVERIAGAAHAVGDLLSGFYAGLTGN